MVGGLLLVTGLQVLNTVHRVRGEGGGGVQRGGVERVVTRCDWHDGAHT